jgi:hypothetical protein
MDAVGIIFAFIVVAAIIAVFAYLSHEQAKKRAAELRAWAARRRLAFSEGREYGVDKEFPDFSSLQRGSNRYAYNIARGNWGGRAVLAFDYHYQTTSSDGKKIQTHHHYLSAAVLDCRMPLGRIEIRPENVLDRVAEFFGFDDIDFESVEFSRAFHVSAKDRKRAYDVVDQRVMEYLLASPRRAISISGRFLCTSDGRTWSPEEMESAIVHLNGLVDRLAPSLVRELLEKG